MPDKYEREIEDILRNLRPTEPKARIGRVPRRPDIRPGKSMPPLIFPEWCLIIAFLAALLAGGWAYVNGGGNLLTGFIALIGAVCIALVALSSFIIKQHSSPSNWR